MFALRGVATGPGYAEPRPALLTLNGRSMSVPAIALLERMSEGSPLNEPMPALSRSVVIWVPATRGVPAEFCTPAGTVVTGAALPTGAERPAGTNSSAIVFSSWLRLLRTGWLAAHRARPPCRPGCRNRPEKPLHGKREFYAVDRIIAQPACEMQAGWRGFRVTAEHHWKPYFAAVPETRRSAASSGFASCGFSCFGGGGGGGGGCEPEKYGATGGEARRA